MLPPNEDVVRPSLPPLAVALTIGGVVPVAVLGVASLGGSPEASLKAVSGLVGYGAVILAFLGGVHWGFALDEDHEDGLALRARLTLGIVPSLIGWAAIMAGLVAGPVLSLAIVIAGLIATVVVESRARRNGLVPHGYMLLRWVATVVVVALLTTVLVLRLFGARVLM